MKALSSTSGTLWVARFMGWHMVLEARTLREAQAIANRNVDGFGGLVGVDRPYVTKASEDDVAEYRAMGGVV